MVSLQRTLSLSLFSLSLSLSLVKNDVASSVCPLCTTRSRSLTRFWTTRGVASKVVQTPTTNWWLNRFLVFLPFLVCKEELKPHCFVFPLRRILCAATGVVDWFKLLLRLLILMSVKQKWCAKLLEISRISGASGYPGVCTTMPSFSLAGPVCGSWALILWVGLWAKDGGSCSPCPSLLASVSLLPGCSSPTSPTPCLGMSSWRMIRAALGQFCTTSWLWSWVASIVGMRCCSTMCTMLSPTPLAPWASVVVSMVGRKCMMRPLRCCTADCGSQTVMRRHKCRRHRRNAHWWWSRAGEQVWASVSKSKWFRGVALVKSQPYSFLQEICSA